MASETLTINGTTYNVVKSSTPEDEESEGRPRLAIHMIRNGIRRYVYVQRPRGQRISEFVEFENGRYRFLTVLP